MAKKEKRPELDMRYQRVVGLNRGRGWVKDTPEGGSVFCVEMPKARQERRDP